MFLRSKLTKGFTRAILALTMVLVAEVSVAAMIFEQTPIDPFNGFQSDLNVGYLNGDDFTVTQVNLQSISWWGYSYTGGNETFDVNIYSGPSDITGLASPLSGVLTATSVLDSNQTEFYLYQLTLNTPLNLAAGDYLLSIQSQDIHDWFWAFGNLGNSQTAYLEPTDSAWNVDNVSGVDMAFRLDGDRPQVIPEPSSMALLLLGFGIIAKSRHFSSNKS